MKIKITEAGNEAFNGWIGDVEFVNGVSVEDQPEQAVAHVGAIYSIELVEDAVDEKAGKKVDEKPAPQVTPQVTTEVTETPEVAEAPETPEEQAETASTDAPAGE